MHGKSREGNVWGEIVWRNVPLGNVWGECLGGKCLRNLLGKTGEISRRRVVQELFKLFRGKLSKGNIQGRKCLGANCLGECSCGKCPGNVWVGIVCGIFWGECSYPIQDYKSLHAML